MNASSSRNRSPLQPHSFTKSAMVWRYSAQGGCSAAAAATISPNGQLFASTPLAMISSTWSCMQSMHEISVFSSLASTFSAFTIRQLAALQRQATAGQNDSDDGDGDGDGDDDNDDDEGPLL